MREIKFRAWGAWHKNMKPEMSYGDDRSYGLTLKGDVVFLDWGGRVSTLTGLTLMQHTGLKDKNGKEIYEGDVCVTDCGNYRCVWIEGSAGFGFQEAGDEYGDFYDGAIHTSVNNFEVIGNIYENPELMDDQKVSDMSKLSR